jgi:hypothetical protein
MLNAVLEPNTIDEVVLRTMIEINDLLNRRFGDRGRAEEESLLVLRLLTSMRRALLT